MPLLVTFDTLIRIESDGKETEVNRGASPPWGDYLRYQYAKFDFSEVTEPGLALAAGEVTGL